MREDEDRAKTELEERWEEIAEADAPERAAPVAREARVVGDQRYPRHGQRDHEVDAEPERPTMARLVPKPADVTVAEDPDREVDDRCGDCPDPDLADEAPHESDWSEQSQHERKPAE